jgi:hypothetical protein
MVTLRHRYSTPANGMDLSDTLNQWLYTLHKTITAAYALYSLYTMQWNWLPYGCALHGPCALLRMNPPTLYVLQTVLLMFMTFELARSGQVPVSYMFVVFIQMILTVMMIWIKRVWYGLDVDM